MKSVIAQGASIAKAIEEALKKADQPKEFFVKLLEDAQPGFLGFGSKKAKIALFFKEEQHMRKNESLFDRGSYENMFNNQAMKKQIEQQLKELGLEIQPIAQSVAPKQAPVQHHTPSKMQTRPLPVRPQRVLQPRPQSTQEPMAPRGLDNQSQGFDQQNQSEEYRRKRRPRYFRPRSQGPRQDDQGADATKDLNKKF